MAEVKLVRLRSVATGAVVQVREEKAEVLGSAWQPADSPQAEKPAARRQSSKSSK
jgi:hypothetical protein